MPRDSNSWKPAILLSAASLSLYAIGAQKVLHGYDVFQLMRWIDQDAVHPRHPGYLALVGLLRCLSRSMGFSAHQTLLAASAIGASLAVGLAHRFALALGASPARAACASATCALTASWFHFATVAEMHAVFLPFAAASLWAMASHLRTGREAPLLLAFAASGTAACVHATGHLLVPLLLSLSCWRVTGCHAPPKAALRALARAPLHAAIWGILSLLLMRSGRTLSTEGAVGFLERAGDPAGALLGIPGSVLRELLVPFAPTSAAVLLLLFHAAWRRVALLLLGAALCYALATAWLLRGGLVEHGAYALPLLPPAAVLLALALRPRTLSAMLVATALFGSCWVFIPRLRTSRAPVDEHLGRALAAAQREMGARILLGDLREYDSALVADPLADVRCIEFEAALLPEGRFPDGPVAVSWLAWEASRAGSEGRRFLVSDSACAFLRSRCPGFDFAWREQKTVEKRRVERPWLEGWEISPR
ncbi:MAG: hypothetical protein Fur0037_18740 [Planctomycetota bacterium]